MRLFVALDVPEETRRKLDELIESLAHTARGARWVRADHIHITLKFIGHSEEGRLPEIKSALCDLRQREPLRMAFRHFGFFPGERHPRVFWVGLEAGPDLAALAADIETALEPCGIPREERKFQPHLTLARFKTEEGLRELRDKLASFPHQEFGETVATEFHLYQSVLKSAGAEYAKLASFRFAAGAKK